MDIKKLQTVVVDALEDVKGQEIMLFDTTGLTSLFDRIAVVSGTSNRQTKALAAPVAMVGAGETSAHSGGWSPVRMEGGTITTGALGLCTGAAGAIAGLTTRTRSMPMVAGIDTGLRPAISAPVGA